MNENTGVSLNFQSPNISTVVYAVQNDKISRHIVAQLRDGSAPWTPPAGSLPTIRYLKPDGTGGFYDVDENNDPAISVSGSVATLTLAEQCTTVPGDVYMQLNFYGTDGSKLTTFAWILRVQKSVLADATIVSSDYYNVLTAAVAQVAADRAAVEAIAEQFTFPLAVAYGGTGANNAADARANLGAMDTSFEPIWLSATLSSLPATITDARIPADTSTTETHAYAFEFGTPSAITSDLTYTITQGQVVLSGSMSGNTTVKFSVAQFLK